MTQTQMLTALIEVPGWLCVVWIFLLGMVVGGLLERHVTRRRLRLKDLIR